MIQMPIATLARHTHILTRSEKANSKAISKLNFAGVAIHILRYVIKNTSAVSWMANWTELFLLCRRKNPKL